MNAFTVSPECISISTSCLESHGEATSPVSLHFRLWDVCPLGIVADNRLRNNGGERLRKVALTSLNQGLESALVLGALNRLCLLNLCAGNRGLKVPFLRQR